MSAVLHHSPTAPLIVGIGGTTRPRSSSELALRIALDAAERRGARTVLFAGPDLGFPLYAPEDPARTPQALDFVEAIRACDGVIVASPGYHGSVSGLIKNALDYIEDLRADARVYLEGRAVGCIACAYGWQATGSTLATLRSVVHALRGWPTPLGVAINSADRIFDADGVCVDEKTRGGLAVMAGQVVDFARMHRSALVA